MESEFLLKGIIIGFSIAAPVGPIGLLCISRTIEKGRMSGFVTGLGAATADGIYGFIAGFGLTFITSFLTSHISIIRFIGGVFLLYLGLKTICEKANPKEIGTKECDLFKNYISTVLLTITNPMTILSFMAIFAGIGLGSTEGGYISSGMLVIGVFCGSGMWWLILSSTISILESRIASKHLKWINIGSGLLICCFSMIALSRVIL